MLVLSNCCYKPLFSGGHESVARKCTAGDSRKRDSSTIRVTKSGQDLFNRQVRFDLRKTRASGFYFNLFFI